MTSLLRGFKFKPTKEELVRYFLSTKLSGRPLPDCYCQLIDHNVYMDHPFNILASTLEKRSVKGKDGLKEGYFFTPRKKISTTSKRISRVIENHGTWTEKSGTTRIYDSGRYIGDFKYYKFNPARGSENSQLNKLDWCMHEYSHVDSQDWVLAHISCKKKKPRKGNSSDNTDNLNSEATPCKRSRVDMGVDDEVGTILNNETEDETRLCDEAGLSFDLGYLNAIQQVVQEQNHGHYQGRVQGHASFEFPTVVEQGERRCDEPLPLFNYECTPIVEHGNNGRIFKNPVERSTSHDQGHGHASYGFPAIQQGEITWNKPVVKREENGRAFETPIQQSTSHNPTRRGYFNPTLADFGL